MPCYIERALLRFQHALNATPEHAPHDNPQQTYGAQSQYAALPTALPTPMALFATAPVTWYCISTAMRPISPRPMPVPALLVTTERFASNLYPTGPQGTFTYTQWRHRRPLSNHARSHVKCIRGRTWCPLPQRQACLSHPYHSRRRSSAITHTHPNQQLHRHRLHQAKHSKGIDMRFYWVRDRLRQCQFLIYWRMGRQNKADFTKHHPSAHHHAI